jgi:ATP-binding cassette subfamily B protein
MTQLKTAEQGQDSSSQLVPNLKPKDKKEKINFGYNLKVYLGLLSRYKWLFFALLLLGLLLEANVTADKFLFKMIIDNGTEFVNGSLSETAFMQLLILIAFLFGAVIVMRALLRWFDMHIINYLDANLMKDLKQKFFNHLLGLSHRFHTSHKTGSLISRLSRGGSAIERMTDMLVFTVLPILFQLVIVSGVIVYFSVVTAVVILITSISFLTYSFIVQQMQQSANLRYNKAEDFEKANIADFFTNTDSIKYYGKEEFIKTRFASISTRTSSAALANWGYYRWLDAGQSIILGAGTFFILYFPLQDFINNRITIGTLAFIYTLYGNLTGPLMSFVRGIRDFYRSMADFNSLFEYGKIENEVKDLPSAIRLKVKQGKIEFENVSFGYGKRKIVSNLNLKIPQGKKVALVGSSGSGKTTLIKLLYRLYDVNEGRILIDGKDIKKLKQESLRSELSIVPQECILFDDSIYNNILFSNPSASRDEVVNAMRFAQLDRFVSNLPEKENTLVGERGVKLSGGEKQRVSIARALLANKRILILDEATSALDSKTEHEIQNDLEKLMKNRTSIIIAHRLSTIMKADMIVVLDKGVISQRGTHDELMREKGTYRELWELQKGGYLQE